jgi:hypothetical protein
MSHDKNQAEVRPAVFFFSFLYSLCIIKHAVNATFCLLFKAENSKYIYELFAKSQGKVRNIGGCLPEQKAIL